MSKREAERIKNEFWDNHSLYVEHDDPIIRKMVASCPTFGRLKYERKTNVVILPCRIGGKLVAKIHGYSIHGRDTRAWYLFSTRWRDRNIDAISLPGTKALVFIPYPRKDRTLEECKDLFIQCVRKIPEF